MEKSGVLVSARNINPVSAMSLDEVKLQCNSFLFKPLPLFRFQFSLDKLNGATRRSPRSKRCRVHCSAGAPVIPYIELSASHEVAQPLATGVPDAAHSVSMLVQNMVLLDLDPATAKLAIAILGPFLPAFGFLFIVRIVMSWYPKLPVGKFPYVLAYAPTEPILVPTRKVIPPLGGVDVTPVVWFGLISFLNEILVGPQGLLVLLSQQQV